MTDTSPKSLSPKSTSPKSRSPKRSLGLVILATDRFNYLAWIRTLLIAIILYAQLSFSGLTEYDTLMLDDRTYDPYMNSRSGSPSSLSIRWVSICRQWCLPLLFWVSGAVAGFDFGQRRCYGLGMIGVLTLVGIVANGSIWILGPQNDQCWPLDHAKPECESGRLFQFSVVAGHGSIFPWISQMWYTIVLAIIILLNMPFMGVLAGRRGFGSLVLQWMIWTLLWGTLLQIASGGTLLERAQLPEKYQWVASEGKDYFESSPEVPDVHLAFAWLAGSEALFLSVSFVASRWKSDSWCPLRIVHYMAGAAMVLTLAAPIATEIATITPSFTMYLLNIMNKSFQMGFMMIRPQVGDQGIDTGNKVEPLFSKYWPLALLWASIVAPSTNFYMAGDLIYPFLPGTLDRCLYVAGAVSVFFMVDRAGHSLESSPVPRAVSSSTLLLYLFYPWVLALLVCAGLRAPEDSIIRTLFTQAGTVWVSTILAVLVPCVFLFSIWSYCCTKRAAARERRTAVTRAWESRIDAQEVYLELISASDDE